MEWREQFKERTYKTYLARLKAHNRIRFRGHAWNASLVSSSTSTAIAAVAVVATDDLYGKSGDLLFAIAALVTLVVSLVVTNRNYDERTRDLFDSYRQIQEVSAEAERLIALDVPVADSRFEELCSRYQQTLDRSENQVSGDFFAANRHNKSVGKGEDAHPGEPTLPRSDSNKVRSEVGKGSFIAEVGLTALALVPIVFSLAILVPVANWLIENL